MKNPSASGGKQPPFLLGSDSPRATTKHSITSSLSAREIVQTE